MYNKETKRKSLSKLKLNLNKGLQVKRKKTTKLNKIPTDSDNSGDENGEYICIYVQESYSSLKLNEAVADLRKKAQVANVGGPFFSGK